jgi:hypothetical protein
LWSLSFWLSNHHYICILLWPICATCQSHPPWFDQSSYI